MTDSSRRQRKLYKDPNDKVIAGVASGVAKYFDIDTTLVRVVWFVLALGGFGILLYVILWFVLEDEPAEVAGVSVATEVGGAVGFDEAAPDEETAGEPGETLEDEQPSETVEGGEPSDVGEDVQSESEPGQGDDEAR